MANVNLKQFSKGILAESWKEVEKKAVKRNVTFFHGGILYTKEEFQKWCNSLTSIDEPEKIVTIKKGMSVGITEGITQQSVYLAPVSEKESEKIKREIQKALSKENRVLLKLREKQLCFISQYVDTWKKVKNILDSVMPDSDKVRFIKGLMEKREKISMEIAGREY